MIPLTFSAYRIGLPLMLAQAQINPGVTAHTGLCPLGVNPMPGLAVHRPSLSIAGYPDAQIPACFVFMPV